MSDIPSTPEELIAQVQPRIDENHALLARIQSGEVADQNIVRNPRGNVCMMYDANWRNPRVVPPIRATRFVNPTAAACTAANTFNGAGERAEVVPLSVALLDDATELQTLVDDLKTGLLGQRMRGQ